jgi:hypothetical protein
LAVDVDAGHHSNPALRLRDKNPAGGTQPG